MFRSAGRSVILQARSTSGAHPIRFFTSLCFSLLPHICMAWLRPSISTTVSWEPSVDTQGVIDDDDVRIALFVLAW